MFDSMINEFKEDVNAGVIRGTPSLKSSLYQFLYILKVSTAFLSKLINDLKRFRDTAAHKMFQFEKFSTTANNSSSCLPVRNCPRETYTLTYTVITIHRTPVCNMHSSEGFASVLRNKNPSGNVMLSLSSSPVSSSFFRKCF